MAGRQYKNDLSDVVGILLEQEKSQQQICLEDIKKAAEKLYGGYDKLSEESRTFIETVYQNPDLTQLYAKVREDEKTNKDILIEFEDNYPDVLNGDKQRCTRGYKRYKETSGLIEWKECQIFHSIFT